MSITHGQYALTVLLAVASAQVFARAADRALCREIARFANASGDGAEHSVVLMNLWGTSDSDGNLLTQACREESSSPPGERLCRYLTENTGWEFQALNAWRVRGCLGDRRAAKPTQMDGADPRDPGGSYRAEHVRGVSRGIWVMVDWGSGGPLRRAIIHGSGSRSSGTVLNAPSRHRSAAPDAHLRDMARQTGHRALPPP